MASDGTNFLVALRADAPAGSRPAGFYTLLFDPSFNPVGPALTYLGTVTDTSGFGRYGTNALWDGRTYVVATGFEALSRVDATNNRVGPETPTVVAYGYNRLPVLASREPGEVLVAAGQDPAGAGNSQTAVRYRDGARLTAAAVPLPLASFSAPSVAWNGERLLALFTSAGATALTRFLPDLTRQDPTPVVTPSVSPPVPVMVVDRAFVVRAGGRQFTVGSTGPAGAPVPVEPHTATAYRRDGRVGLGVICDSTSSRPRASARRIDAAGRNLDPAPIEIPGVINSSCAALPLHDGRNLLLVYASQTPLAGCAFSPVRMIRISDDGDPLDAEGLPIACLRDSPRTLALASDGTTHLLVGTSPGVLEATRFRSDGAVLDRSPVTVATSTAVVTSPMLAFDGTDFVVFWLGQGTARGGDGMIGRGLRGARVGLDGTVRDPGGALVVDDPLLGPEVSVASNGAGRTWLAYARNTAETSGWMAFVREVDLRAPGGVDGGAPDAAIDIGMDAPADARADAAPDMTVDVTVDTRPDVLADASVDVRTDAAPDAAIDARTDVVVDADADAAPDVPVVDVQSPTDGAAGDTPEDAPDATADVTTREDATPDAGAEDAPAPEDVTADAAPGDAAPSPPAPGCAQCNAGASRSSRGALGYAALLPLALAARRRRRVTR